MHQLSTHWFAALNPISGFATAPNIGSTLIGMSRSMSSSLRLRLLNIIRPMYLYLAAFILNLPLRLVAYIS